MKHLNNGLNKISKILAFSLTLMLCSPAAYAVTKFEQLNAAAETAYRSKNYPEAQKNFELAVKESEKMDKSDKRIATTVYNLALVFQAEGNYPESEKNMLKALDIITYLYGAEHQKVGQLYLDLADLYVEQAGQEEKPELKKKAAENYKKGIDIFEKIYAQATGQIEGGDKGEKPKDDVKESGKKSQSSKTSGQLAAADLANALRLLADCYAEDELYKQADPLFARSLELEEYASGPDDIDLANHKAKVAEYYCIQSKYKLAEPLFKEALAASEKKHGAESPITANILYNFGGLYYDQGGFGDAEIYFKRGLKIWEKLGEMKPDELAQKTLALADVLDMEGKHEEAHAAYKKSLAVLDKNPDKSVVIRSLKAYQKHLLMQNNKDEAGKIANRIKDLRAEQGGTKQQ